MGAEVIKVESCSRMDISRGAARPTSQGEGLYPGVNLVSVRGTAPPITCTAMATSAVSPWTWRRRVARHSSWLATICDVLIENFRASVMDRLGLGYEALSQANPRLIYVKISSQGATGPERDYGSLGSTLSKRLASPRSRVMRTAGPS